MPDVVFSTCDLAGLVPLPKKDANKYTRGTLNVVGGSALYPGAAVLAARAAQRAGAGYTQVWCAPESVNTVRAGNPSLVVRAWESAALGNALQKLQRRDWQRCDWSQYSQQRCNRSWQEDQCSNQEGSKQQERKGSATPIFEAHPAAVLVGCGFCGEGDQEALLLRLVLRQQVPAVVDAGGITLLAQVAAREGFDLLQERYLSGVPLVLTPHAGEAARLLQAQKVGNGKGETAKSIQGEKQESDVSFAHANDCAAACSGDLLADQRRRACEISAAYGATVVLKGPQTIIACGQSTYLMDKGTSALAKAGTGDVLAGIIAALLAQGMPPFEAAVLGARLHANAGNAAACRLSAVSVIPEDVVDCIPCAIKELLA